MNRKGQEKFLSGWNILVWVILAGFLLISVSIYNRATADTREAEARILNQKLFNCLTEDNKLKYDINESFNIYPTCKINPLLFEDQLVFFARVELINLNDGKVLVSRDFGNPDLYFRCQIQASDGKGASCFVESLNVENFKDYGKVKLKIVTGSNYGGEVTINAPADTTGGGTSSGGNS